MIRLKVLLLPDALKPAEFADRAFYLTTYNDAPLHVGDVVAAKGTKQNAMIRAIWFTVGRSGPHLPVKQTESGHKHILQLDQSLGDVTEQKSIDLNIISRAD